MNVKAKYGALATVALVLIAGFQYLAMLELPQYHDVMKYLYFIPIILAAYFLGWKGGILCALVASFISSLHLILHSSVFYLEYLLQSLMFALGGGLLGLLSDRDRQKRLIIEQSKIDFLKALSRSLDARDTYTEGHSNRVAAIAGEIGKNAGLTNDEVNNVYEAGLMHDIGKIGIPDSILRKEGTLDLHEFEIIKSHTVIGGEILSYVELLRQLVPAIRHHHERYDGSGYPDQLVGEEIPPVARILSIADAFDAMTSQRTYNRRKSFEDAVKEIEKKAGTQFDPRFVDSLRKSFNKLKNIALENTSIDVECKPVR